MKQDITQYFVETYLKVTQCWVIFQFVAAVILENDNILAIHWRKHFTEAATERSSSSLCLAAFIKII